MKSLNNILNFIFAICLLGLTACEKVIDLELQESDPSLVVEGILTNKLEPYKVRLTLTKDYFSSEDAPLVDDAMVTISDDAGNLDTLIYKNDGYYETASDRQGEVGRTYTLNITQGEKFYSASSTMKEQFIIDSLQYVYVGESGLGFIQEGYQLVIYGQEDPDPNGYVWFRFYSNDTLLTEPFRYFADKDDFLNGSYVVAQMPYTFSKDVMAKVEVYSITKEHYEFLYALMNQLNSNGGPFDAPPATPPTNISNGAIGFWGAASIDDDEIMIE
jgi:hypothetical protein